jgi:hypothetical protein
MGKIEDLMEQFNDVSDKIKRELNKKQKELENKQRQLEEQDMFSSFDPELVETFFKKPYVTLPRKINEWWLIIPKFYDMNVGYLHKSTDSFNVFIVNKYADYLGAVPEEFRKMFKFKPALPIKLFNGMLLTGEEHQDKISTPLVQ